MPELAARLLRAGRARLTLMCITRARIRACGSLARVTLAREVIVTAAETKIKDGRLADEVSLGFASGAMEALLHEIALWNGARG